MQSSNRATNLLTNWSTRQLFDLSIFSGSIDECVMICREKLAQKKLFTIATPNPEQVVMASEQSSFLKTLQSFDLRIPDGQGLIWAGMIARKQLKERIGGRELVARLLPIIKDQKQTALVIGGVGYDQTLNVGPQSSVVMKEITVKSTPIMWARNFDKASPEHTKQVVEWISKNRPEVVFVALGAPYQEQWIVEHKVALEKAGVRLAMVVGGAFDTLTGNLAQPPQSVQKLGFEWLWRLIQQPWRWKRQLKLMKFVRLTFFSQT